MSLTTWGGRINQISLFHPLSVVVVEVVVEVEVVIEEVVNVGSVVDAGDMWGKEEGGRK